MLRSALKTSLFALLLIYSTQRDTSASLTQAIELFTAQRYTESQLQLDRFISVHPENATAHYYLGQIHLHLTTYDKAIKHCKQAINIEANQAEYHFCLARGYGGKARRAPPWYQAILAFKVRRELKQAVALDPDHVQARIGLIKFYMQAPRIMGGSLDKAQVQAQYLVRLAPDQGQALLQKIASQSNNVTVLPTSPSFARPKEHLQP